MNNNWQAATLKNIDLQLKNDPGVIALYVFGSFAEQADSLDAWSDLDLLIVIKDNSVSRFYPTLDWLSSYGEIFAYEQSNDEKSHTSKVIFDNNQKIDFVFVTESKLNQEIMKNKKLKLIFSKTSKPNNALNSQVPNPGTTQQNNLTQLTNSFWYLAYTALAKTSRNDLIIGLHLTLELYQKYLELVMWQRDRELNTNIHRMGSILNEKIQQLHFVLRVDKPRDIIEMIDNIITEFDRLMAALDLSYISKLSTTRSLISIAKKSI